jgi:hypothetical protein
MGRNWIFRKFQGEGAATGFFAQIKIFRGPPTSYTENYENQENSTKSRENGQELDFSHKFNFRAPPTSSGGEISKIAKIGHRSVFGGVPVDLCSKFQKSRKFD